MQRVAARANLVTRLAASHMASGGRVGVAAVGPASSSCVTGVAPSGAHQRRWHIMADGSTYKPKGLAQASMSMPQTEKATEQFNQLAKTAHQTRNLRDAVHLYDRVLTYRREKLGPDHPQVAAALHNLARVFIDLRDQKQAEIALTEACRIYEKVEGVDSLKYADSKGLLALCYRDMQLFEDSEKAFKESLKVFRDNVFDFDSNAWVPKHGDPPPNPNESPLATVAHLLSDAAVLFLYQQQQERAASFLEDSLEIRRFLYSNNRKFKPIIAQTLSKLSEVRRSQGRITEAEETIGEALDICIETMGRDSPATAAAYTSKGNCHSSKREFKEALKCFQEAATTYALNFGKVSPLVASEMMHIGRMYEMLHDMKQAEIHYDKCITMTKEVLGPDHVQIADGSAFLASVHMKRQRNDLAVPLLRDAVRIRTRVNKNDPALVFVYHRLGDALSSMGDPEAEAYFLMAIELHRQHDTHTQRLLLSDCLDDLGLHYVQFKHFDKAQAVLKEALDTRLELLGDNHPTTGYSWSNLAVLHLSQEQHRDGAKAAETALEVYSKSKMDDGQRLSVADAYMTLGQCLHGLGDLQGARTNHNHCLNIRRISGEHAELGVAEVLNELARVSLDQNKQGEASDYLAEAFKICDKYGDNAARLREHLKRTQSLFDKEAAVPPSPDAPSPLPRLHRQEDPRL